MSAHQTPGAIVRMAHAGLGVDDIRVKSGWSYADIAKALGRVETLHPLAKLAGRRDAEDRARIAREAGW